MIGPLQLLARVAQRDPGSVLSLQKFLGPEDDELIRVVGIAYQLGLEASGGPAETFEVSPEYRNLLLEQLQVVADLSAKDRTPEQWKEPGRVVVTVRSEMEVVR